MSDPLPAARSSHTCTETSDGGIDLTFGQTRRLFNDPMPFAGVCATVFRSRIGWPCYGSIGSDRDCRKVGAGRWRSHQRLEPCQTDERQHSSRAAFGVLLLASPINCSGSRNSCQRQSIEPRGPRRLVGAHVARDSPQAADFSGSTARKARAEKCGGDDNRVIKALGRDSTDPHLSDWDWNLYPLAMRVYPSTRPLLAAVPACTSQPSRGRDRARP